MAKKNGKGTLEAVGNVYLTGFMCAGKTTAGRALARLLKRPFRDSDLLLERRAGEKAGDLIKRRGLRTFRALEAAQLRELAALGGNIVALGGGIYPSRRWERLLKSTGTVIFLSCPWPELEKRLKAARGPRPLLAGPWKTARRRAKKLYAARLPFYRKAQVAVTTAGHTPERTAALIRKEL
jgi:shikimate kinase